MGIFGDVVLVVGRDERLSGVDALMAEFRMSPRRQLARSELPVEQRLEPTSQQHHAHLVERGHRQFELVHDGVDRLIED
jgi:hypothetical protein